MYVSISSRRNRPLLALLLLVGCATTSQILPISPALDTSALPPRGEGRTLTLKVIDSRASTVVGYRDPKDTRTVITTASETIRNIQTALAQAYTELGFRVVTPSGGPADIALEVRLVALGYARQADGVVRNLRTGATVEASSVIGTKTTTGTYHFGQGKDTVMTPSLHENASILNRHLNAALAQLIADARLTTE